MGGSQNRYTLHISKLVKHRRYPRGRVALLCGRDPLMHFITTYGEEHKSNCLTCIKIYDKVQKTQQERKA